MRKTFEYKCQQCGSTIKVLPNGDHRIRSVDICPKCGGIIILQTDSVKTK